MKLVQDRPFVRLLLFATLASREKSKAAQPSVTDGPLPMAMAFASFLVKIRVRASTHLLNA